MRNTVFYLLALSLIIFACGGGDPASSGTEAILNGWFPQQFKVKTTDHQASDTLSLVAVQSQTDPSLSFTLDYFSQKKDGGLDKKTVEAVIAAAKVNAKPAKSLLDVLQKNGIMNALVGTNLDKNEVMIQLYLEPFNSVFNGKMKQIQKLSAEWAAQRKMAPCKFTLLVMDPKAWGQKFTGLIDARFFDRKDAWTDQNAIAEANADLADPGSAEFLPGSLRLSGDRELEIRQKVHDEVSDFLRTSQKADFHVELSAMVNSVWDLRSMDKIRYDFPYCQKTEETEQNNSCMGQFDGRISCEYFFSTGKMEVDIR
jgi:hypothetical protein